MVSTKAFRFAATTTIVSVFAATSVYAAMRYVRGGHTVPSISLTVTYSERHMGTGGDLPATLIVAVRGDGSRVRAVHYGEDASSAREIRSVVDIGTRTKTVLASHVQSKTTYHYTEDQIASVRSLDISCPKNLGGEKEILGYTAVPSTVELTTPTGEVFKSLTFYAPDLGCIPLEVRMTQIFPDGTERDTRHMTVDTVDVGEPSAALFAIPSNYEEMSPEDYVRRIRATGNPSLSESNDVVQFLESNYEQTRDGKR